MALILLALEGPHKGESFVIREGSEVGRARGQVLLKKDSKVSNHHASVILDAKGHLVLVDKGSSNGIKVNGEKVKKIRLTPGVRFHIGRSLLEVRLKGEEVVEEESYAPERNLGPATAIAPELPPIPEEKSPLVDNRTEPPPEPGTVTQAPPAAFEPEPVPETRPAAPPERHWSQILGEAIAANPLERTVPKVSVKPFERLVTLRYVEGQQADDVITLGFGPREFGSDNLDFEVEEKITPAIAFTLQPTPGGAALTTDFPRLVQVNDIPGTRHDLKEGDLIRIGNSKIRIEFEK